jgi:hypothetical protein
VSVPNYWLQPMMFAGMLVNIRSRVYPGCAEPSASILSADRATRWQADILPELSYEYDSCIA